MTKNTTIALQGAAKLASRLVITLAAVGALSLVALSAHAAAPAPTDGFWYDVVHNDEVQVSMRDKSERIRKNDDGKPIVVATFRWYFKREDHIEVFQYYVLLSDCRKNQGQLVMMNMSGRVKHVGDWAAGAGSINSEIADMLCYVVTVDDELKAAGLPGLR
jgi:hypothetical protein